MVVGQGTVYVASQRYGRAYVVVAALIPDLLERTGKKLSRINSILLVPETR
jgi:hypothetical protein